MASRSSWSISAAFSIVLAVTFAAQSTGDIVFEMTSAAPALADGLNNGDTITVNGITMTFSNVVVSDGSGSGDVESAGILISATTEAGLTDVHRFDFSFSENLMITNYTIGSHEDVPANSFMTVSGFNGTSGDNLIPAGNSSSDTSLVFDAGTIPVFEAGQVYSFNHNLTNAVDSTFNLRSFSASSVPEPGSACLIVSAMVGLALRRKRTARVSF